jgi:hypothetical protein
MNQTRHKNKPQTVSNGKKSVRIWKLKSPSQDALDRLKGELQGWDGESNLDLVWNDTLTMEVITLS